MGTGSTPTSRIVVAAPLYPPESGGPATYAKMIEEALPTHGFTITILPFRDVRHLPKVIRHAAYTWRLVRAARQHDLIYALDGVSVGVPALIAHWLTRRPYLVRLGGDYAWEQGQQRFGLTADLDAYTAHPERASVPVRILAKIQHVVVRHALRVVVPSDYLRSIVATWGVRPERLVRIYTELAPLYEARDKMTVRRELQLPDGPVVLSFGRLVPWKGNHALIDAVALLRSTFPTIQLIIGGDGPEEQSLIEHAERVSMATQIRFMGRFSRSQVAAYVRAADVYVLNTGYEGLSHQLLEVMSLGTPIVTTAVGGNRELITDGETGRIVPYNDVQALQTAVGELLTDHTVATTLTTNARARTAAFAEAVVVGELVTLLRSL